MLQSSVILVLVRGVKVLSEQRVHKVTNLKIAQNSRIDTGKSPKHPEMP